VNKPTAAFESERRARENIEKKLAYLTSAMAGRNSSKIGLANNQRRPILNFPRSLRQFNLWDGNVGADYLEATGVRRNSHETLRRYPELCNAVSEAIAVLRIDGVFDLSTPREERQNSLRRRLVESEMLRSIAEFTQIGDARARKAGEGK
jgi:hypothetical protein